jgi:hypothetical protein
MYLSLHLSAQEYTPSYIVFGQDTLNRVNKLGNKEGAWLQYEPNPFEIIEISDSFDDSSSVRYYTYFKQDSMYDIGDVTITERQFYENGKKSGIWYGYYIDEELRYKTFFHEKIKYETFFNNDSLLKVIGYNLGGKKSMLIKRKNLTDSFVVKRKNLLTIIMKEEEVLGMFGFPITSDNFLYWENIGIKKQNRILQSKEVYEIVREVYNGTFSPTDDDLTMELLDTLSNLHSNEGIRALYFYIYNKILQKSDGALSELFDDPCFNILISNSGYVIFYLQDKQELLEKYALMLGCEFAYKEQGYYSSYKYDYAEFKEIVSKNLAKDQILLKTFSQLCSEIEKIMITCN